MSGNGWLCDKVRILFWNWPKRVRFFTSGAQVVGFWRGTAERAWPRIGVFLERFWSSFWRFSWAFWGGRSAVGLCLRCVGREATKKGASDSMRAVGCTEKGNHGAEIRRKLALRSSARGCHSPRGRRGEAVFVARPWPTAVGRRGSGVRGRFRVGKGERLTGWDDYLWVYFSYSLMYSITMSMASGRMSLMRGLLTQACTVG